MAVAALGRASLRLVAGASLATRERHEPSSVCDMIRRKRLRRTRAGGFRLDLPPEERRCFARSCRRCATCSRRRSTTAVAGVSTPPRSPTTPRRRRSTSASCRRSWSPRVAAVEAVEASLDAKELDEAQAVAWMTSVNTVRLVLGTMLDVSEELEIEGVPDDDPDIHSYALYAYLSLLLEELTDVVNR